MGIGVKRFWAWLWTPVRRVSTNAECPICGQPVVVADDRTVGLGAAGPMMAPHTREELVAACVTHGHPPFNDGSRAAERHSR